LQRHELNALDLRCTELGALTEGLGRDYENVHTDVQRLKEIGLVERAEDDNVEMPWDAVEAKLRLAA
jgi:predicted transcriptional regulator